MKTILFQGDSITDADRNRDNDSYRGSGYATIVSGKLGFEYPGEYTFLNRGISGDRVVSLVEREKRDIINLKPDIMSILIGVNDVWRDFDAQNGISAEKYERLYDILISDIKEALPEIKIMIMEPFVLKGSGTREYWDDFRAEVLLRAEAAQRIAEKHGLAFIRLQDKFDAVYDTMPEDYWLLDGVHPSAAGHELISNEWIKMFNTIK